MAIPTSDCPCNVTDTSACELRNCSSRMEHNTLCSAHTILPDGNDNYNVNNCPGANNVFRCAQRGIYASNIYLTDDSP